MPGSPRSSALRSFFSWTAGSVTASRGNEMRAIEISKATSAGRSASWAGRMTAGPSGAGT
jgi:hypothetical protein